VKYSILIIEFYGIRKSRVSWWYLIGDGRKKPEHEVMWGHPHAQVIFTLYPYSEKH
jgi:hypothetical protein